MDIEDNAEALRLREATAMIITRLEALLRIFGDQIQTHADTVCMGFTHLQPAEPTTIGYRLAFYAQDLLEDYLSLKTLHNNIRGKGIKGAVGTSASYSQLLEGTQFSTQDLEDAIMQATDLPAYDIAHQTYTRRQDWQLVSALAGIAMTLNKFAFDLRIMQSPPIGEWSEPFGKHQIGSSAMPFKRNPINSENINSLTRIVATLPRIMWDNTANSLLERILDDSGNRRTTLPQAYLVTDEIIKRTNRLIKGLNFNEYQIQHNLEIYGVFFATERVLMQAVKAGGNRQELHETIRLNSLSAWQAIQQGQDNPLANLMSEDQTILQYLDSQTIRDLLNADSYIGDAPKRARLLVEKIFKML
jgi:adenylosuccinate lyase